MAFTPLGATDEAELDFDLLFDEDASGGECDQSWHDDTMTHMNLRVMRRLLATDTDAFDRQVADQVRATVASTSSSVREDVMGALFTALAASGHKVFLCRAPGSGQPGQLCFTHTYMALQKDNTDGTSTLLLIEPTLRDEFHVVRSQAAYTRLLEALPKVFVGPPRQLAALIDFMAVRMEESFRAGGMTSPPWRQKASLLARWELSMGAHASHVVPCSTFGSKTRSPIFRASPVVQFKPSPSAAPLPTHTPTPTITKSSPTSAAACPLPTTAPTAPLPPLTTPSTRGVMTLTDTQCAALAALFRPPAAATTPLRPLSVNTSVHSHGRRQMRRASAHVAMGFRMRGGVVCLQPTYVKC